MENKLFVTWEDVEFFIKNVAKKYQESNISGVFGVPRGGVILATLLAYKMKRPLLMAPCRNCIIIDDICDSGESLLHYAKNSSGNGKDKGYHIVTMYYKKNKLVTPEFYLYEKRDRWIVYPWENKEEKLQSKIVKLTSFEG